MIKTKKFLQLNEDMRAANRDARMKYDSIVKPAQEQFRLKERNARINLEQTTAPLWDAMPQIIGYGETKSPITEKYGQTLYGIIKSPKIAKDNEEFLRKQIDLVEENYKKIVDIAKSEYYIIEKPAKQNMEEAISLARVPYEEYSSEITSKSWDIREWFAFRKTYKQILEPELRIRNLTKEEGKQQNKNIHNKFKIKSLKTKDKLKTTIMVSTHMFVGHCIEKLDKIAAMNYFWWAMKPNNNYPLYGEWFRLWENTKISELIRLKKIDLTRSSDETVDSLMKNKNLTFKEWSERKNR